MNDCNKSQNDIAKPDERAPELTDQLNLLEAVDRRITPEHVARRFRELLDDIGDNSLAAPLSATAGDGMTAARSGPERARPAKAVHSTGTVMGTRGGTLVADGPAARRLRPQTSATRAAETLDLRAQLGRPRVVRFPSDWWESPAVANQPFGPNPSEARTVRRFAKELLTNWGLVSLSGDAETIVGELAANAIRHGLPSTAPVGPGALRLCLLRRTGEVMLAVIDPSDEAPVLRQPDLGDESGRGLQIIDALSDIWGWSPVAGHGKAVWAILFTVAA